MISLFLVYLSSSLSLSLSIKLSFSDSSLKTPSYISSPSTETSSFTSSILSHFILHKSVHFKQLSMQHHFPVIHFFGHVHAINSNISSGAGRTLTHLMAKFSPSYIQPCSTGDGTSRFASNDIFQILDM